VSQRNKKLVAYLTILVIPLSLLFLNSEKIIPFKTSVVDKTSWITRLLLFPITEVKKVLLYRRTFTDYQELKSDYETLQARLIGYEEVIRENTRFERLLDFKRKLIFSSVAANVIARNPANWSASLVIDKGSEDGLKQGMPVVTNLGVVGKIAEVGERTSKVLLLNDPNFSVAAIIQESRESGLISGTLQGLCRMRYLSPDANVEIGNKVITSRLSSSFPEGLLIGEVIGVEESQSSPSVECIVRPAVNFSQIEEAIVILK
jgi:rod shape-determining protein MreC